MNDNVKVKSESHIKIIDVTDKEKPKKILSRRLFNDKSNKKTTINKIDDKETKGKDA